MAKAKGTAQNARLIEEQMSEAAQHLSQALVNLRAAMEAVQVGEREVDFKLPEFENLKGLLHIGFGSANRIANDWDGNASARETR